MEKPIIQGSFVLKKGKEKGAWTFIEMEPMDHLPKKKNSTVRVRGFIDHYELRDFHIWALKKGTFLSVKADIRKAIKKEDGDHVRLELYLDEAPPVAQDDLILCLQEEPSLLQKFQSLTAARRKEIVDWVFSAQTDDAKVERIGKVMESLENGELHLL